MLLPLLLSLLPQDTFSQPSTALQGLVFLMRSPTSVARSGYFPDLRSALERADDGDTLILEPGLFTGPGNKDLVITKDVAIRGRFGALGSVIDCEGAGHAFDFQGAQALVEGLTIRGGMAYEGGGARVSDATVHFRDTTFEDNSATLGGAVSGDYTSVLLLTDCRLLRNSANQGGGISASGGGTLSQCLFEENIALLGGGLFLSMDLFPTQVLHLTECTFRRNSADAGGGGVTVFLFGNLTMDRCTLVENRTNGGGGGVLFAASFGGVFYLRNSLVLRNASGSGTGGASGGPAGISNCTVVENTSMSGQPGGIRTGSAQRPSVVLNCVIRDNRSAAGTTLGQQIQHDGGLFVPPDLTLLYSNVEGLVGSPTNIDLDPWFVDPASGDYHILPSSPCVDAGLAFSWTNLQLDIDNEPRFQGLSVDIGCDEVPVPAGP